MTIGKSHVRMKLGNKSRGNSKKFFRHINKKNWGVGEGGEIKSAAMK